MELELGTVCSGRKTARRSGRESIRDLTGSHPSFFATLRVPLRRGRLLSEQDERDAPAVAVVSEEMAHQNWPGQDALGKHIQVGHPGTAGPLRTIVEIVGDVRPNPFDAIPPPPFTCHSRNSPS